MDDKSSTSEQWVAIQNGGLAEPSGDITICENVTVEELDLTALDEPLSVENRTTKGLSGVWEDGRPPRSGTSDDIEKAINAMVKELIRLDEELNVLTGKRVGIQTSDSSVIMVDAIANIWYRAEV